jgi:hypothetical protein
LGDNLATHLKKRIHLRLGRTFEELADERAHERTLRELGVDEAIIASMMDDYRWRRDEGASPRPL